MNQYWSEWRPVLVTKCTYTDSRADQYWSNRRPVLVHFPSSFSFLILEQDKTTAPRYSQLAHDTTLHRTTSSKWSEMIELQDYSNRHSLSKQ